MRMTIVIKQVIVKSPLLQLVDINYTMPLTIKTDPHIVTV